MSILKQGRNYWRKEHSERVSFLVDGAEIFKAFYKALQKAEKQVIITGWDTDSRIHLVTPDNQDAGVPTNLGSFLKELTRRKPDLKIYILSWDFSIFYSLEREPLPQVKFARLANERLRFVLDGSHPALASHHQKVVVIDDSVAFSGGLDITMRRWDTPEHFAYDPRRIDPLGKHYGPFHDVQIAVEGDAARALGDLVRDRWFFATGERLESVEERGDRWPESCHVDLESVDVAIVRTLPAYKGRRPVYEVERLFLDAIGRAENFIFIENQYFTSLPIGKAISRRLSEPDGPEIVMICPRDATGWIEESTMTVLRSRVLSLIREADRYGRFRIYYPIVPGIEPGYLKVHSKVMVVDDEFLRIGSANLNHRSMGVDTECDIAIEACGRTRVRNAIAEFRTELLCEHLNVDAAEFKAHFRASGSLLNTVEFFRRGPRTLVELDREVPTWLDAIVPESEYIDPRAPMRLKRWGRRLLGGVAGRRSFKILLSLFVVFSLAVAWSWTPIELWLRPERITNVIYNLQKYPYGYFTVILSFLIGSLFLVPVTLLILAASFLFSAEEAFVLAATGSLLGATLTYWLGMYLGRKQVNRMTRGWLSKVRRRLVRGGIVAVAIFRLIPLAPFTVVNMVAGALRIRFRDFLIGTFVAMIPGIALLTLLADAIKSLIRSPDLLGLIRFALFLVVVSLAIQGLQYFVRNRYSHA